MQLSTNSSESGVNYDELKERKFSNLEDFKSFCESLGISFDANFTVTDSSIDYSMGRLANINPDGSIEFSIGAKISTPAFKIIIERAINNSSISITPDQSLLAPAPVITQASDSARQKIDRTMLTYCAKGKLEFDESTREYFIIGYDSFEPRNDVEVRFKLEDISWVQDYENGEDKSDENDKIFYPNVQKLLKEFIDSGSVLLLHDRSTEGKTKIEIEVQFDLRRNLQQ